MQFRSVSVELTKSISKDDKHANGIYFTPKEDRDVVFALLAKYVTNPSSILEPSFGSGEFLEDIYETYPNAHITGIELNPLLHTSSSRPNTLRCDFMTYEGRHDVIIGNPPFCVIPATMNTKQYQTGRPNLFVSFLMKAVHSNLEDGGVLAFILPTSFYNCGFYEKSRQSLFEATTILEVLPLTGNYLETQQRTFALVLRKGHTYDAYWFRRNSRMYLTPHAKELNVLVSGTNTLQELGFKVKTGSVVWNQEKDNLANEGTLLVYSSNISTGSLVYGVKPPKQQYIRDFRTPPITTPTILINRGYGNTELVLNVVLIQDIPFYAENHVNTIQTTTGRHIPEVLASLKCEKTRRFIELFVGNGALSKTELEQCLPIWLDA